MNMKKRIIIACSLIFLFISINSAKAQPVPPCIFYGYVTVEGQPAQDVLTVTAVVQGVSRNWTTQTANGTYGMPNMGSGTPIAVDSDLIETAEKEGAMNGEHVEFYVDGNKTSQTAIFRSGDPIRIDLSLGGTGSESASSAFDMNLVSAAAIAVSAAIGSVAIFWIHRRGYRIQVAKRERRLRERHRK